MAGRVVIEGKSGRGYANGSKTSRCKGRRGSGTEGEGLGDPEIPSIRRRSGPDEWPRRGPGGHASGSSRR